MAYDTQRWATLVQRLREHPAARHRLVVDSLTAAGMVAVELALTGLLPSQLRPASWAAALAWSVAGAAPAVLRRAAPWVAIGLALAVLVASVIIDHDRQPVTLALSYVWLTYSTAARFTARRALLAAAVLWLPVLVGNLLWPDAAQANPSGLSDAYLSLTNAMVALVSFFVGRTVHNRRAYTAALEERARTAEENLRGLAEQAVADERRRIARELHDVVAHHVSVMGVLATGARRVLHRAPEAADEALRTIEETGRTTLREMRRLLLILRTEAEPAAELAPQPGLAGVQALVEQVGEAGLPVTLHVDGQPSPLDPGVALTVYRVVQEALTNALKHAGAATAEVRLGFGSHWLTVEVSDTGRGPRPDGARLGHGLLGMRERVALYGGTLRTGPRPGGGFRVYAKIPTDQLASAKGLP